MKGFWAITAALSLLMAPLSAKHVHYFGKDRRYFGRYDVAQFVEKFVQNHEAIFPKFRELWQVSPVEGSQGGFILEARNEDNPSYIFLEFSTIDNGAGIVTLVTRDRASDTEVTDATILFENKQDMLLFPGGGRAPENAYYVKMMQDFVVYVIAQHQAKLQEAGQEAQKQEKAQ